MASFGDMAFFYNKKNKKNIERNEINEQVQEFLNKGGVIHKQKDGYAINSIRSEMFDEFSGFLDVA